MNDKYALLDLLEVIVLYIMSSPCSAVIFDSWQQDRSRRHILVQHWIHKLYTNMYHSYFKSQISHGNPIPSFTALAT